MPSFAAHAATDVLAEASGIRTNARASSFAGHAATSALVLPLVMTPGMARAQVRTTPAVTSVTADTAQLRRKFEPGLAEARGIRTSARASASAAAAVGVLVDPATLVEMAVDAARAGDVETLERLLAAGVPVDAASPRGDSLLMLAAYYGHAAAVRALLARGADPERGGAQGQSPLAGVAFKGLIAVAEALVAGGAAVDATMGDGRTPLMMAAAFNRVEMVAWLLAHGASADARDATGARAIDIAQGLGASDVVDLLRSR